jgi:hypothetical protein
VGTGRILALVALLADLSLAALNDLVALTVGTEHGNEHHHDLPYERTNMAYLTAKVQI